jgi:hypothetical protein
VWFGVGVYIAVQTAREATCISHLKTIGNALLNYKEEHGTFPPAYIADKDGKPMHSWRVLILPYLEQHDLYAQYHFDEPWNSEHNRRLAVQIPSEYRCPADPSDAKTTTSYLAVVGSQVAWPGDRPISNAESGDGDAILVVEASNSDIDWLEPRDMGFSEAIRGVNADTGFGIRSRHADLANCLLMTGGVESLHNNISEPLLLKLLRTTRLGR